MNTLLIYFLLFSASSFSQETELERVQRNKDNKIKTNLQWKDYYEKLLASGNSTAKDSTIIVKVIQNHFSVDKILNNIDVGDIHKKKPTSCITDNLQQTFRAQKKKMLIVTHASLVFDQAADAREGINKTISECQKADSDIVFLTSSSNTSGDMDWYTQDKEPTVTLYSSAGEFSIEALENVDDITVVGGYWGACHGDSLKSIAKVALNKNKTFIIHVPMKAVYVAPHGTLADEYQFEEDTILEKLKKILNFEQYKHAQISIDGQIKKKAESRMLLNIQLSSM